MPRFSTTLDADQFEWVKDEAQRRGRSQADIVRLCIDAVRTGPVNIGEHPTQPVNTESVADLRDRVAELERRVDDLEAGGDPTPAADIEVPADPVSEPQPYGQRCQEAVAVLRRADRPLQKGAIMSAVGDEEISDDSLWRRHIRPAIKKAGAELDGRRWTLDE